MFNNSNGYSLADIAAVTNGNDGFGGNNGGAWWLLILFLFGFMNGGWGNGFFGGGMGGNGYTNMMLGYDFPWLINGQQGINSNVSNGFRDAQLNDNITSIREGISDISTQICGLGGNIQNALCSGFAGTTAAITGAQNGITQQLQNNEIANLQRSFAEQTTNTAGFTALQSQLAQCCCDNRLATADTKYTIATEACANRTLAANNTRDIIDSQTRGTQAIIDKLCALELDGYKRENDQLRTQLNMATLRESQAAQNAFIAQGFTNEIDSLYNRLSNCPVPSVPVYGKQPIFTCGGNGCGCGNTFAA